MYSTIDSIVQLVPLQKPKDFFQTRQDFISLPLSLFCVDCGFQASISTFFILSYAALLIPLICSDISNNYNFSVMCYCTYRHDIYYIYIISKILFGIRFVRTQKVVEDSTEIFIQHFNIICDKCQCEKWTNVCKDRSLRTVILLKI